ncbi:hypothetical protein DPMN_156788 [Dreissena polymorpha]|uniref:Uncharacterized protein n=1 Tax=Dreissena polymorpha TaxID=45954 RepID=A0A9D4JC55_DREPO|nr:hypothetical protein DPMN_156788 [Dreissena polymorpha]
MSPQGPWPSCFRHFFWHFFRICNILCISAAYDLGGVVTNSRKEGETTNNKPKRPGTLKEMHW